MSLIIPFQRDGFAREMKPKISGNNLTLEYDNIESSLFKVGQEIAELLSTEVYELICVGSTTPTDKVVQAKDYLQRSMLHFAIYQHSIYLIAKIGNDGITVKKTDTETTIYKYQQDELNNKLISDAWFWMNQLIKYLNANDSVFTVWKDSDAKKELDAIPVTISDFKKWVGVSSEYFMLNASWIVREVWSDCVLSRAKEPVKDDPMTRAVCYEVMARCCQRLSYYCLPEPIRMDINNEMDSKNKKDLPEAFIRDKVATQFLVKADGYWRSWDNKITAAAESNVSTNASTEVYQSKRICSDDSFVY